MLQQDFVIAIVMLFILLPAARLIRRLIYALFDMFDRGNPVDEGTDSMVSTSMKALFFGKSLGRLAGAITRGLTGPRGGGGGGGPLAVSAGSSSPDRLASIANVQNSQASGIGSLKSAFGNTVGQSGSGNEKGRGLLSNGLMPNDGPIQQYGHLPENNRLSIPEWQGRDILQTGSLLATGTDNQTNVIPFRPGGFRNYAVPVAERGRPTIQAMGGIQRGVQSARVSSSAGIGAGSRTASYRGTGHSRTLSSPPNIVSINPAGTSRVIGHLNTPNMAQIRPVATGLDSSKTSNILATRPEPVRIQPASGNQVSRPSIQPGTPYAGGGQNSFRPQAGTVVQRPSNFTNSSPGPDSSIGQSRLTSSDTSQQNRQDIHIQQAMNTPIVRQEPPKIRNYTERNEG